MQIEIHNYLSCSHLLESQSGAWDSIVILDSSLSESEFVRQNSKRSLQLQFDDITQNLEQKILPSENAIRSALDFANESQKLIVCCRAGQSRSSATAFSIAFEKFGEQFALDLLNPKRHSPNHFILQIADKLIERLGLLNAYDNWGYNIGDIRLTDHLDEIESEYDQLESIGARDRISNTLGNAR